MLSMLSHWQSIIHNMKSSRYTRNIDLNQHAHTVSLCKFSLLSDQIKLGRSSVQIATQIHQSWPFWGTMQMQRCFGLSLHPRDSVAPDSQFRINLRQNEKNITSWIIPAVDAGFSRGSVAQYQTQLCSMTNIKEEKSAISVVDVVERSPAFSVPKITAPHAIHSPPVFVFCCYTFPKSQNPKSQNPEFPKSPPVFVLCWYSQTFDVQVFLFGIVISGPYQLVLQQYA